ncbi:hypothetical protein D8811_07440 [Streptococcus gordonii]|jgi:hypothetical protein|uniref:DUF4649 family protein n=1 Tax=Streptococcus gordonii TaxID=1302 RepID=A0AB35FTT8_STRGN|nr:MULTISPECIES: DUF4649 family protein [Streptococcus]MBZ2127792.1 DUF4649 family protein [Streptococcus gordonii]MBZ2130120.1 DUF4649 family protein [Streptococcus gordonii]OFL23038.1 DUF4649 domain-containing protein [Streptococcus sp. HMSC062B01]OFU72524.1 DUF4649 domain-containing protein [Streptococcus sp. HMSC10A01]RSJ40499.1 hypothetical protein D8819_09145 [Streptococcus gordonii]
MIELKYLDSYKVERIVRYLDFDEFMLAFSGCVTIPDDLTVLSLTYKGIEVPYEGKIGNLYRTMLQFDLSAYESKKEN